MSDTTLLLLGYIDPGTGSLLFQAIAASAITGLLMLTKVKSALYSFFSWPINWVRRRRSKGPR